jgi:DNA invertase Pin-like site-specific DNA recombinase
LAQALEWAREGDTFVVTRIDRLARSVTDLNGIIRRLREKGVHFRSIMQGEFDTSSSTSALFLNILGAVAEFETQLRAERQAEGIARVRETGRTKTGKATGRPRVDPAPILRLRAEGVSPVEIARRLKVARSTVYAALATAGEEGGG